MVELATRKHCRADERERDAGEGRLRLDGFDKREAVVVGMFRSLFLLPDRTNFDMFLNKTVGEQTQEFSFAMADLLMFGAAHSPKDRATLFLAAEERRTDRDLKLMLLSPHFAG